MEYFEFKHAKAEVKRLDEVTQLIDNHIQGTDATDHPAKLLYLSSLRHLASALSVYRDAVQDFIKLDSTDWDAIFGQEANSEPDSIE